MRGPLASLQKYFIKLSFKNLVTDWISTLIYFYTPVLVLVVCNTVLFAVTAHRIRTIRQETAILKGSESARSDRLKKDKQR